MTHLELADWQEHNALLEEGLWPERAERSRATAAALRSLVAQMDAEQQRAIDAVARVFDEVERRIEHYAFMTALSRVVAVDDVRRILREMREAT